MALTFKLLEDELTALVDLYTQNTWDFHFDPSPTAEDITERFKSGWFSDDRETYWVENHGEKVGLVIIGDFSDTIPLMYDVRLANKARGKGYGEQCVSWIVDHIFSSSKSKIRIESYTRCDNYAMRKVLYNCNFQKEGYLRKSWENDDRTIDDTIVYGIIREDWENGERTSINLDDMPF
ncbi:GNAT family N-acetyltransferase [Alkalibacillus haloalkaliphilus]|uniref:GNAT family N-acetyltransferase n=1 Tax=Alkalibacillus haloalkaliphilus TaxID=94136 RepID=UPI0029365DC9|nr:GNAT family protein [Alkalibacillus haloalkaliphilus]MDV2583221.1 GNAT family protein [Alkalibacillus haloalkaliphilus]